MAAASVAGAAWQGQRESDPGHLGSVSLNGSTAAMEPGQFQPQS